MKTTSTRKPVALHEWAAVRRELARRDRELFGDDGFQRNGLRNEQYFHLWQRILARLTEVLGTKRIRGSEIAELEKLACDLERAQSRRRLPRRLVSKIVPRGPHATVRKAQA